MSGTPLPSVSEVREQISHPIIDADGHLLESVPLLLRHVGDLFDGAAVERLRAALPSLFTGEGSSAEGIPRGPWWPSSTDADYQATVMIPALLAERMEEIGVDFTILYPSLGLGLCTIPEAETRIPAVRALNAMLAELCHAQRAWLTPAAVIPMHTPAEAIDELRNVHALGLKAAMIPPAVARPLAAYPELFPRLCHADRFGIDSAHDYDPVWRCFEELGIAVTVHGAVGLRCLPDGRGSPSNYSYNHVLGHGYLQSEACRSLVYGGVPSRFPKLHFAFLEGGADWACAMLGGLVEHWEKRGPKGLSEYDPARLDTERLSALLEQHGLPAQPPEMIGEVCPWARNEFAASGIDGEADLARIFGEQFFFGCESDDTSAHRALDGPGNKLGVALPAIFSSDIGHWDVPTLSDPVPQSWQLVERGLLSAADYQRFVFDLTARLHMGMNPAFFAGTRVEIETSKLAVA
jgi:predicted TIM-barrel fold metal-dependent hydrolase